MINQSVPWRLLFLLLLLLSSPGVLGGCSYTPDANGHVTVPDGVERLEDGAFNGCWSLVSITLPDSLASIGNAAFYVCTSLVSITLPDGLTSLGSSAFRGCQSLALVYVPTGCAVGTNAFDGTAGGYAYAPLPPPAPPTSPPSPPSPPPDPSSPPAPPSPPTSPTIEGSSSNIGGTLAVLAAPIVIFIVAPIFIAIFFIFIVCKKKSPDAGGVVMSGVALSATSDETKV